MKLKSILLMSFGLLSLGNSYGQSYMSTAGQKYTLVEEGTGTWCGYCPDGAQIIQQSIEPTCTHCVAIAWHNGDAMALSPDDFNNTYIGGSTGPGWPGGSVDRTVSTHDYGSSGGMITRVGHNRAFWSADVSTQNALTPKFDVKMISTFDSVTRIIKITVTGKAIVAGTGSWKLNALVVEDSVASTGSNAQHSYMFSGPSTSWFMNQCVAPCPGYPCSSCAVLPDSIYSHMGVVRADLATGGSMWGDSTMTNPHAGDSLSKTYTYTIPTTSSWKRFKVVGFVSKFGALPTDRAVENVIEAKVKGMWKVYPAPTGVETMSRAMVDVELAPNPAANYVSVRGTLAQPTETKITISNAAGQLVIEKQYPAGGTLFAEHISLNNISNGIYFMNIINNGESVTRKFVVNK